MKVFKNLWEFFDKNPGKYYFASTKAKHRYDEVNFEDDAYIFFGKETKGLPEELLHENYDRAIRIPMGQNIRSLNLSNKDTLRNTTTNKRARGAQQISGRAAHSK